MAGGIDSVEDDELLYRRVPAIWYDAAINGPLPQAFSPNKDRDITGLSVWRAKYKSIAEVASGQPGKTYYVAVLRAGDLRQHGVDIAVRPNTTAGFDPGHVELSNINASNRKTTTTLEMVQALSELCIDILGPFETPAIPPS